MNPSNPSDLEKSAQEKLDADFEDFLRGDDSRIAALYRKLPRAEPAAALDARVRALAQSALRENAAQTSHRGTAIPQRRAARWLPVFGAAAMVMLAAGVTWRLAPQMWPVQEPVASRSSLDTAGTSDVAGVQQRAAIAGQARDGDAPAPVNPVGAPSPVATLAAPAAQREASAQASQSAAPMPAKRASAPSAAASPADSQAAERGALYRQQLHRAEAAKPAPLPFPAPPAAMSKSIAPAATLPSPAAEKFKSDAAKVEETATMNLAPASAPTALPETIHSAPPQPTSMAAPAPPPAPPPPAAAPPPPPAEPEQAPMPESTAAPSRLSSPAAPVAGSAATNSAEGVNGDLYKQQDNIASLQQHWIERIRDLLQKHQRDEARWNLREFRKQYPDYALPPDLRNLK